MFACAAEIEPVKTDWIVPGSVPVGDLTVICGPPGSGKSNTVDYLTACLSVKNTCLVLKGEDDPASVVVPRLKNYEFANLRNVFIETDIQLPGEISRLEEAIALHKPRVVIIDLLDSFTSNSLNYASAAKHLIEPLLKLARKYQFAIVGVQHLIKNFSEKKIIAGVLGSVKVVGLARSVLLVRQYDGMGQIDHIKSNLSKLAETEFFQIIDEKGVSKLEFSPGVWNDLQPQPELIAAEEETRILPMPPRIENINKTIAIGDMIISKIKPDQPNSKKTLAQAQAMLGVLKIVRGFLPAKIDSG